MPACVGARPAQESRKRAASSLDWLRAAPTTDFCHASCHEPAPLPQNSINVLRLVAHRIFRLAITPERAPKVRRVIDFDGRNSLWDVHSMIQTTFKLDWDHLYAFYLSGKYFDRETEFSDDNSGGRAADTALLFRLGLRAGKSFVYLFDFGDELRHTVTVVSVTDVDAPLKKPVLVESVGKAPPQYPGDEDSDDEDSDDEDSDDEDSDDEDSDDEEPKAVPPELVVLAPLAEKVFDLAERVGLLEGEESDEDEGEESSPAALDSESEAATLRELAQAALELARELEGDRQRFDAVEDWAGEGELMALLFELPARLSVSGETERALAVAEAFTFLAPDQFRGELGLVLARAGRHEEAKAQVALNLESFENASVAEGRAGDVYRALGEPASAEAYYRRAIVEAKGFGDRALAASRLSSFLLDSGRKREAAAVIEQLELPSARAPTKRNTPAVGRNEPCPCGSGKKYKKCHGANA
jgi:hypothetical protein